MFRVLGYNCHKIISKSINRSHTYTIRHTLFCGSITPFNLKQWNYLTKDKATLDNKNLDLSLYHTGIILNSFLSVHKDSLLQKTTSYLLRMKRLCYSVTCQYVAIKVATEMTVVNIQGCYANGMCFSNMTCLLMDKGINRKITCKFQEGFVRFTW